MPNTIDMHVALVFRVSSIYRSIDRWENARLFNVIISEYLNQILFLVMDVT